MKRFGLFIFLLIISSICKADDFFNPPPLNPELPPWMQNSAPAPDSQQQGQAQPSPDSAAQPDTSADTTSDEEDAATPFDFESGTSDGGPARDQGKSSFQVLDQMGSSQQQDCVGWGAAFLGTKVFPNQSSCRNELDQEVENARDSINNYTDHTEKEVLRGVIRGKIPREKSKDFHLDFSMLKSALSMAAKTGCTCLE